MKHLEHCKGLGCSSESSDGFGRFKQNNTIRYIFWMLTLAAMLEQSGEE